MAGPLLRHPWLLVFHWVSGLREREMREAPPPTVAEPLPFCPLFTPVLPPLTRARASALPASPMPIRISACSSGRAPANRPVAPPRSLFPSCSLLLLLSRGEPAFQAPQGLGAARLPDEWRPPHVHPAPPPARAVVSFSFITHAGTPTFCPPPPPTRV